MDDNKFRTLAQYIAELRRRDRDDHGTDKSASFDTTTEDDFGWEERHGNRVNGLGPNSPGQGGDNL